MNYIAEIKAFYDLLEINPSLTHGAINLWHGLMCIANKAGWKDKFTVAISTLEAKTGLNKQAIIRSRNQLTQSGLIQYESRKGNLSAIYHINSLCDKTIYNFDTQSDTQTDTQSDTQTDTQSDTINKLNETKLNKTNKKNIKKGQYADEVTLTIDEYKKLSEMVDDGFADECINVLNCYKLSSGKKYKSDYHAILNWVADKVKQTYQPKPKQMEYEPVKPRTAEEIANMSLEELFVHG